MWMIMTMKGEAEGIISAPGQQASKWSNAVIWTSTEPALMMALIHAPLLHFESHMQLLECDDARRLNFYFLSFSSD